MGTTKHRETLQNKSYWRHENRAGRGWEVAWPVCYMFVYWKSTNTYYVVGTIPCALYIHSHNKTVISLLQMGNWGTKKLNNLPKVPWSVVDRARLETQADQLHFLNPFTMLTLTDEQKRGWGTWAFKIGKAQLHLDSQGLSLYKGKEASTKSR